MEEEFWDEVSAHYDAEICNTLKADRNDSLRRTIREWARGKDLATDFGCGVGRFIPLLCKCVNRVIATDFSANSLKLAEEVIPKGKQVELRKANLVSGGPRWEKADFGLLINVLIMPDAEQRRAIIKNVRRNLKPDAILVVVVPSMESALYAYSRQIEWSQRAGQSRKSAVREVDREIAKEIESIASGIVRIDGTSTKHSLKEELVVFFQQNKFQVERIDKVEFDWTEEFANPPRWLKAPYPWDWLFIVRRR